MRQQAWWMAAVLWSASAAALAGVGGAYSTPLGGMDLRVTGEAVTGTSHGGGPCGFKKGQKVLQGQLLDDSVAGKLTVCGTGEGCGVEDAFTVLLVARKGALLSGAVQVKGKQCTLPIEGKSLRLSRADPPRKHAEDKAAPNAGTPPNAKNKNARDKPSAQNAQPGAKGDGKDGDASTPFADWNPESAQPVGAAQPNRKAALSKAREAEALLNAGQFEPAQKVLLESIRLDPGYAEGYLMVGVTFYARHRYDDALDWYKKALTVNPDFGDAYYNIACIYSMEQKKPLALKYLRIAVLNGYKDKGAMDIDEDLDNLREEPEYLDLLKTLATGAPATPSPAPP